MDQQLEEKVDTQYAFLNAVYIGTKLEELKLSLASQENQTLKPSQIVIVEDGEVSAEVKAYLDSLDSLLYTLVPIEQNVGLGLALREGMNHVKYELVARMDSDDITTPDRAEKQVQRMLQDPELSVVGGNMGEFIGDTENIVGYREVPQTHEEICRYMKSRCPFNHITVMLRKSHVEKAGGYQHFLYNEDGYLWARMYLSGAKFCNLPDVVAYARVGEEMYRRRGGYRYFKWEKALYRFMKKNKIISGFAYCKAVMVRFVVQVLMPNSVRQWYFKRFARKQSAVRQPVDRGEK